jgi:hypothetical protein
MRTWLQTHPGRDISGAGQVRMSAEVPRILQRGSGQVTFIRTQLYASGQITDGPEVV